MENYKCRVALIQSTTTLNFCDPNNDSKVLAIANALGETKVNGELESFNEKTFSYTVATVDTAETTHGIKDGELNTNIITNIEPSTSYLAGYCKNYTFPDGVTRGYLGGVYEIACIFVNKTAIDTCLAACGGTVLFMGDSSSNNIGTGSSSCSWNPGEASSNSYPVTQVNNTFQSACRIKSTKSYARPIAHYE